MKRHLTLAVLSLVILCVLGNSFGSAPKAFAETKNTAQSHIASLASLSAVTAPTPAGTAGPGELSCGTILSTNPLNWILCPVIDILTSVTDLVDGWITQELCINTSQIFYTSGSCGDTSLSATDQKSSGAYYKAWSDFRNIALGLMAIAGLIIVISQALGIEILDAYTIRKTLPRLLIAAIGITLSWPIMQFLVTLSNDLGFGIRHLIYAPFSGPGLGNNIDLNFGSSSIGGSIGGGIENFLLGSVGLVAGLAAAVAMIGIIISLAGTAALAVLIAIMVLILRQVAIILLILIAPLAIVAYILPNTQKTYKFWWESFSKALLMFPLIAALIATGRVFSAVTLANDSSILGKIIGFLAYFAPYFLIPITFRLAGGAVRQLSGLANDRSRGAFDRLKQGRGKRMQQIGSKGTAGQLYKGKSWIPGSITAARVGNIMAKGAGTGMQGHYGLGARGKSARGQVELAAAEEARKDPRMQAILTHDDTNRVLALANGDEKQGKRLLRSHLIDQGVAPAEADRRVSAAAADAISAGGFTKPNAGAAFYNLSQNASGIVDPDDAANLAAIVGNGNMLNVEEYAAKGASISRQVGRGELGASPQVAADLATSRARGEHLTNPAVYRGRLNDAIISGAGGASMHAALDGKGTAARNLMQAARDIVVEGEGGATGYTGPQVQQAAAILVGAQRSTRMGYVKGNNAQIVNDELSDPVLASSLKAYLAVPVPAGTVAPGASHVTPTTNQDVIDNIVGEMYLGGPGTPGSPIGAGGGAGPTPGGTPGAGPLLPPPVIISDRHLKRNIVHISNTFDGIKLYSFQYLWSDQVYVGVMAQDLIYSHPEALSKDLNGYYRVNYNLLGIRMMTLEEWSVANTASQQVL